MHARDELPCIPATDEKVTPAYLREESDKLLHISAPEEKILPAHLREEIVGKILGQNKLILDKYVVTYSDNKFYLLDVSALPKVKLIEFLECRSRVYNKNPDYNSHFQVPHFYDADYRKFRVRVGENGFFGIYYPGVASVFLKNLKNEKPQHVRSYQDGDITFRKNDENYLSRVQPFISSDAGLYVRISEPTNDFNKHSDHYSIFNAETGKKLYNSTCNIYPRFIFKPFYLVNGTVKDSQFIAMFTSEFNQKKFSVNITTKDEKGANRAPDKMGMSPDGKYFYTVAADRLHVYTSMEDKLDCNEIVNHKTRRVSINTKIDHSRQPKFHGNYIVFAQYYYCKCPSLFAYNLQNPNDNGELGELEDLGDGDFKSRANYPDEFCMDENGIILQPHVNSQSTFMNFDDDKDYPLSASLIQVPTDSMTPKELKLNVISELSKRDQQPQLTCNIPIELCEIIAEYAVPELFSQDSNRNFLWKYAKFKSLETLKLNVMSELFKGDQQPQLTSNIPKELCTLIAEYAVPNSYDPRNYLLWFIRLNIFNFLAHSQNQTHKLFFNLVLASYDITKTKAEQIQVLTACGAEFGMDFAAVERLLNSAYCQMLTNLNEYLSEFIESTQLTKAKEAVAPDAKSGDTGISAVVSDSGAVQTDRERLSASVLPKLSIVSTNGKSSDQADRDPMAAQSDVQKAGAFKT